MSSDGSCSSRGAGRSTRSSAAVAVAVELEIISRSIFDRAAASANCSGLKRLTVAAQLQVAARRAARAASAMGARSLRIRGNKGINRHFSSIHMNKILKQTQVE
jgi:hypothetical protein